MNRLTGLRYLVPLREGGSLPAVVETDEPGAYVVKFRGAGQGVKALIAELLAAELALLLGLPVPAPAVVDLDAGFGAGEPDPEIQDILRGSVGANFGLAYLAGALAFRAGRMADRRGTLHRPCRVPRGICRLFPRPARRAAPLRRGGTRCRRAPSGLATP
ncbi:MAG: hypothetical protein LC793_07965 [Thermomicrobia bacterium]|nr:hypothetical protein [Thermomicrobia bacterium]